MHSGEDMKNLNPRRLQERCGDSRAVFHLFKHIFQVPGIILSVMGTEVRELWTLLPMESGGNMDRNCIEITYIII